jgi:hypothetical protein
MMAAAMPAGSALADTPKWGAHLNSVEARLNRSLTPGAHSPAAPD